MPDRCAVYGCSNEASLERKISVHRIPYFNNNSATAKKRRKQWEDFVKRKRAKWSPTKNSAVCSEHFTPDSFERRFDFLPGQARLIKDDVGIVSTPTIYKPVAKDEDVLSIRSRRLVRNRFSLFTSFIYKIIANRYHISLTFLVCFYFA
jgi:hypothetical protein